MKAVILGCGQVGSELAGTLVRAAVECTIVDPDEDAFLRLPQDFGGTTLVGNGLDEDALRRAGIESAEVFVVATARDNLNLMVAQFVRARFKTPNIIVRVYDPDKAELFAGLGLNTYCPTKETLVAMQRMIVGEKG